jgi:uncharacterized repeat protein (TIGR03803 family)
VDWASFTDKPGIIFRVTAQGGFTMVHAFDGTSGGNPSGRLTRGIDGFFYGTTQNGGGANKGTIFRLAPGLFPTRAGRSRPAAEAGAAEEDFTMVHSFAGGAEGAGPTGGIIQGFDGKLYGTTTSGGPSNRGSAFLADIDVPPAPILNISTRLLVQGGDSVLIGGFIITGQDSKKVIVRGIGPSLTAAGVEAALPDALLELHAGNGELLGSNNNWKDSQRSEIEATYHSAEYDLESAIVQTLAPGAYTAVLQDKNSTSGIGVVEVYDLSQAAASKLANISTRGFVETGDNIMIGGFIVGQGGRAAASVLVRGIGPSLANAGVNGPLQDPTMELRDGNGGLVAANDNWKQTQRAEIEATTIPPASDLESAIVANLFPGAYTAILRGQGNTTGIGLVEVYALQ